MFDNIHLMRQLGGMHLYYVCLSIYAVNFLQTHGSFSSFKTILKGALRRIFKNKIQIKRIIDCP